MWATMLTREEPTRLQHIVTTNNPLVQVPPASRLVNAVLFAWVLCRRALSRIRSSSSVKMLSPLVVICFTCLMIVGTRTSAPMPCFPQYALANFR